MYSHAAPLLAIVSGAPRAGLAVGLMVNYGVGQQFDFNADVFFYVVLPPIIFHQVRASECSRDTPRARFPFERLRAAFSAGFYNFVCPLACAVLFAL